MRIIVCTDEKERGKAGCFKGTMLQVLFIFQYILEGLAVLFILHSYNIMTAKTGHYCIKETGMLETEGFWFMTLMILIGCKLVTFWIWREPDVQE